MSTTPAGLQRQLNALQLFCEQRQLSVNLAKTKVVTFGSRAKCQTFTFNGNEVERVQSYKYLGFEFHATKSLAHGVSKLVSAANKAMHAMNRRCAFLHISDPKQRCNLFDNLVLPILSYASEVWAVDEGVGKAAEQLHRQFLKHVLCVRGNTANLIVLAEFGRYPLCFHWWQQILRYHNRINTLSDDERLLKCAFVEGLHDPTHRFWSHDVLLPREHRSCLVCGSDRAEDEHHFVFDCPAYCSIRDRFTAIFWGPAPSLSSFFTLHDPRVIAKLLHECFAHRSMLLEDLLAVPQH
ncbi:hypothetical protein ABBQ32_14236 [Trebouxia sp. C0010 RCD-2024]